MRLVKQCSSALSYCQANRWGSLLGGSALMFWGLKRRGWTGWLAASAGCDLVTRGFLGRGWFGQAIDPKSRGGRNTSVGYNSSIRVDHTITVNKAPEELYRLWRNFENLPRFMDHLHEVRVLDDKRSHWVVTGPAGLKVEWDAEIVNDIPNRLIGWRSIGTPDVDNAGSVHFEKMDGRGTQVKVVLRYDPPAGTAGARFAGLFGHDPAEKVADDMRRFKLYAEGGQPGEVPFYEPLPKAAV